MNNVVVGKVMKRQIYSVGEWADNGTVVITNVGFKVNDENDDTNVILPSEIEEEGVIYKTFLKEITCILNVEGRQKLYTRKYFQYISRERNWKTIPFFFDERTRNRYRFVDIQEDHDHDRKTHGSSGSSKSTLKRKRTNGLHL